MTREEILQAAEDLPPHELDALVSDFVRLSARRKGDNLSELETALFARINTSLPEETWTRYQALLDLEREGSLSPEQRDEMLRIGDELESQNADRIEAVTDLALLRNVSLRQMMHDLGVQGPRDAEKAS